MALPRLDIDHDRIVFGTFGGQAHHDPGEDAVVAPALPAVVEGLGRAVFLRRIAPAQPIAIDEDYTAQNAPIIDAGLARSSRKQSPGLFSDPPHLWSAPRKVALPELGFLGLWVVSRKWWKLDGGVISG